MSSLKNRTIFTRDNLEVMRGMADECIDLIYLDPPFNSNHNYAAPIGSKAAGAEFKDTWSLDEIDLAWHGEIAEAHPGLYKLLEATREIHGNSMMAYLVYMAVRVMEMKRVLKPAGSIYLHCDPTASHYLKLLMDEVFGRKTFKNEIVWKRSSSHNRAKRWGPVHDILLFYGGGFWNRVLEPLDQDYVDRFYRYSDSRGRYMVDNLTGPGPRDGDTGQPWRNIDPSERGRHWELPPDRALPEWFVFPEGYASMLARQRLDVLDKQHMIHWPSRGTMPRFKRYLTEKSGQPVNDVIMDISPLVASVKERTGYPTQKPLKLLERIIEASSNEGDMVLDPFCGCATTCVAAEKLNRQWIGIDISEKAAELVKDRINRELGILLFKPIHRFDVPTDKDGKRSKNIKHILYGIQEGKCTGCLHHFPFQNFTVDHIVPKSKGGPDTDENLQLLCGYCNSVKGNRTQEYLISQVRRTA